MKNVLFYKGWNYVIEQLYYQWCFYLRKTVMDYLLSEYDMIFTVISPQTDCWGDY